MKKGFIFTTDIIIAILTTFVFITIAFWYMSQIQTINWNKPGLYQFAQDSLIVLDKKGDLVRDVQNNDNTTLQLFLNTMPDQICGNITVYSVTKTTVTPTALSAKKKNCDNSNEVTIAGRGFIISKRVGDLVTVEYYYARMGVWFA